MPNTMTGRVILVRPTQTIPTKSGVEFRKREIVLDCTRHDPITGERGFDNTPVFTFTQDRCSLLDNIQPGQIVTVSFDITGRKSADASKPDTYYNDVRGYKIEVRGAQQPSAAPVQMAAQPAYTQAAPPQTAAPQGAAYTPQAQYPQQPQYAQPQYPQYPPQSQEPPF